MWKNSTDKRNFLRTVGRRSVDYKSTDEIADNPKFSTDRSVRRLPTSEFENIAPVVPPVCGFFGFCGQFLNMFTFFKSKSKTWFL